MNEMIDLWGEKERKKLLMLVLVASMDKKIFFFVSFSTTHDKLFRRPYYCHTV